MKKIISVILSLMLIASLSVTAFAAEETGSITINGVSESTTYEIYKLLDLESYDVDAGAYSYKANAAWANFFATDEAKAYMATDDDGYVTWATADDDDTKAAFAKMALAYAKANSINPVKSSENDGEFVITGTTGKFDGLELGYYLVDSTMGALCGLTTTNPHASINVKNGIPTIDKQVNEDSTSQWGATNTSDIGQTIEYRVTINVHAGAENYVLHDVMAAGLTYIGVSKIEHVVPGTGTHDVTADKYEVKTGTAVVTDGCTFEVHFSKAMCDELETNDKIIVYYTAMLNRNAVINEDGNLNTAWLTFGEGGVSNEDAVTTYTYGIDIVKTDSANKLIDGAQFKIYDAANGGNEVAVVMMDDGVTYRRARADETGIAIVVTDGKVRVVGFDNGTYYLEETEAPDGYNKLSARQKFIVSDANLDAVFNDGVYSTGSGVHVVNKTGSMLPETGGMGTVLFITFGTIVVLGAGVLLVTKKRMSMIKD
ncbi:MAG: SpaH/EbpB family LPXTG-anchored major pilin [Clostridia bacterium]|nr:SpaH/EbpB family LPXTG-anchored major pilin [Clostridia bacterium]